MEEPDSTDEQRIRKHHTRSRAGCLTCKKRHVRCDGNQPICKRCTTRRIECSWPSLNLPLREQRISYLPGEHKPWPVTQVLPVPYKVPSRSIKLDPFDTLPIKMSPNSMEVLSYFHRLNNYYDISSSARDKEVLRSIVQNPTSIRHTILIAGLHYTWMTGDLEKHSLTVLSHTAEAISLLNKEIQVMKSTGDLSLVKHIANLSLLECGYGNCKSAEMHLNALITVLEHHFMFAKNPEMGFEEEMAFRFFALTFNYVHNLRSRMHESKEFHDLVNGGQAPKMSELYVLVQKLHRNDIGCLKLQLQAVSMYPFFYPNFPSTTKFYVTDVSGAVNGLRSLTALVQSEAEFEEMVKNPGWAWDEGSISRSQLGVMNAHVASLFKPNKKPTIDPLSGKPLTTTWLNYTIATGFYLHRVLHVWNANKPMEKRLLRLVMKIYTQALHQEIHMSNMHCCPDLWLWENFVVAYFLETHQLDEHDDTLVEIEHHLDAAIYLWSQTFHVIAWDEVHRRLMTIAWPRNHPQEVPEMVWTRALKSGGAK